MMPARGLSVAPHLLTHLLAKCGMKPFEDAILPPQPKIVVHGFPRREIVRKQAPRASASQRIENGIHDLTVAISARSPMERGHRKQRSDAAPFRIAQIG